MHDRENPQNDPLLAPNPEPAPETIAAPPPARGRWDHVAADLRVPWDWRDILVFLVFAIGSSIVVVAFFTPIIVAVLRLQVTDLQKEMQSGVLGLLTQTIWWAVVLMFLYALIRVRFETPFWRTLGFRPLHSKRMSPLGVALGWILAGMMMAWIVALASYLSVPTKEMPIQQLLKSRETILMLTFMGVAVAPLAEEVIFRGFLYPTIARNIGVTGGVLLTGLLFGLMHAAQLSGGNWQIVLLVLVGILFTWVRARTGSVTTCYLLHVGYNAFLFIGLYAQTGGLKNLPGQ